ncbi:MAG: hypothetical protein GXO89_00485 [Chlorobi bacterium]|nr:hypothetical protein [Chlorobiota bacterium]
MKKPIILLHLVFVLTLSNLLAQGNTDSIEHSLFKIKYEHNEIIDSRGHDIGTTKLHFKNKTIELTDNELFRISQNGQIAAIKDFSPINDTINELTFYDTLGIILSKFKVPSLPLGIDVSNNGSFILYGRKPTKNSSEYWDTTYLKVYDPNGELIFSNTESYGYSYSKAFSNSGNIFAYLTTVLEETDIFKIELLIFKNLDTNPLFVIVELNDWPSNPSLFTTAILIDEEKEILSIRRSRPKLENIHRFEKETVYYNFHGQFIEIVKGWTL